MTRVDLNALTVAVDELAASAGSSREGFLLDFGLRLHDTPERWTYASTPVNSLTFASTGGDGVHFGLLQTPSAVTSDGPVVMTVPSASRANHVIAESIGEFLELGCLHGWFTLEQLAYRPDYTFKLYARAIAPTEPLIGQLFDVLSLSPCALQPSRIDWLSREYDASIAVAPATTEQKPFDRQAFLAWKRAKYGGP